MKKYFQNPLVLPVLALFVSGILGGLPPIAIKLALRELSSPMVMFLRFSIMLPIFFAFSWKYIRSTRMEWGSIFFIASGWVSNLIIFSLAIPHTTAVLSQVIYTSVPIFVAILSVLVLKEFPMKLQVIGIGIGLVGTVIAAVGGGTKLSGGNIFGNIMMVLASVAWSWYVIATRKYGTRVPVQVNLLVSVGITWMYFGLICFFATPTVSIVSLNTITIHSLLFLGIICGVVMFSMQQWGAQRAPAVMSGSTSYVSVISSIIGSWWILGEKLESHERFGLLLLLVAVMLTTTIPLLVRHVRKKSE